MKVEVKSSKPTFRPAAPPKYLPSILSSHASSETTFSYFLYLAITMILHSIYHAMKCNNSLLLLTLIPICNRPFTITSLDLKSFYILYYEIYTKISMLFPVRKQDYPAINKFSCTITKDLGFFSSSPRLNRTAGALWVFRRLNDRRIRVVYKKSSA
jgi:hypothetical protein